MKKVMAFGTFDLLHLGHLRYLSGAKKLGNHLIVVVSTDKNVILLKGKKPVFSQKERALMVGSLKMVKQAVVGRESDFYFLVKKFKPQILALGYDNSESIEKVKRELLKRKIVSKVVVIPAFNIKKFKGEKIRKKIFENICKNGK